MPTRTPFMICAGLIAVSLAAGCVQTTRTKKTRTYQIKTTPAGASVWVKDAIGQRPVGNSPVTLDLEYTVERRDFNSHWWWSLGGGLAAAGAGVGLMEGTGQWELGIATVGFGGAIALVSAILCGLGESQVGETAEQRQVVIGADLPGFQTLVSDLQIPADDQALTLKLAALGDGATADQGATRPDPAGPRGDPVPTGGRRGADIIAVFDVHDVSGKTEQNILLQLTAYLSTALTTSGKFKVIPRHQLRQRLLDQKSESYRECFEEACQIELGKTLSAQKSLSTQLLKVGRKCAVTANLYDLKTETAEKGAMVNTDCEPDKLLEAMGEVAQQLCAD